MNAPFVRTAREFESLPSTSDTARELVERGGIDLPLLVWAHRQTSGRGRGTNTWWSDEGSLTFTLAIDPRVHGLRPEHEPRVALAVAGTICRMLDDFEIIGRIGIRWPNDVECEGRKLAGILPERVETAEGPRLLIGVGLNVFTRFDEAPEAIRAMATSIAQKSHRDPEDLGELLDHLVWLLEEFPDILGRLASDDPTLSDRWRYLDLLMNQFIRLKTETGIVEGIACGVTADGGLRLRPIGGFEQVFYGGQVLRS